MEEKNVSYLDRNNNLVNSNKDYAIIKRQYFLNDEVKSEMYFDSSEEPAKLSKGQSGVLYSKGQIQYLNENGDVMFFPELLLQSNPCICILFGVLIVFISRALSHKKCNWLLYLYLLFLTYLTLLCRVKQDLIIQSDLFFTFKRFVTIYTDRLYIIENIWLFIPFSFVYTKRKGFINGFISGIVLSISIELLQLIFHCGTVDIDDIIANSIGTVIGVILYYFLGDMKLPSSLKRKIENKVISA